MATIAKQTVTRAGLVLATAAASAGGDEFVNDGKKMLYAENSSGVQRTISITPQKEVDGQTIPAKTLVLEDGESGFIGPFPGNLYNDTDGNVQLIYSSETGVVVAVLEFDPVVNLSLAALLTDL